MLSSLTIRNIALIEQLSIDFQDGFHVLTGETGAGKSILIDAISFVLGERASRSIIQNGKNKASVEAVFRSDHRQHLFSVLDEIGILTDPDDEELVLYREISLSGKNVCRLNGVLIPVTSLKRVGDILIDIHGQHTHQSLLNPRYHGFFLDAFAGQQAADIKKKIAICCEAFRAAQKELLSGFPDEQERARQISLLAYQVEEIDRAGLQPSEEEELIARRNIAANAQRIMEVLQDSHALLSGHDPNASSLLSDAVQQMDSIADYADIYRQAAQKLQETSYLLEDAVFTIRDLKNTFEYDSSLLPQIEERLDTIYSLKRKYGNTIPEILEYRNTVQTQLEAYSNSDQRRSELQDICRQEQAKYAALAQQLFVLRREASLRLEKGIALQFADLGLEKAHLSVCFEKNATPTPNPEGTEKIEFLFSANVGQPPEPLHLVASGGELARVMLALKTELADTDDIPTLIFDEIDTGISGRIGTAVGHKMHRIASSRQVLCITHLPQVAAFADRHFLVEKHTDGVKTVSEVRPLDTEEHKKEVASLMGSTSNMQHGLALAEELILQAAQLDQAAQEK